MKPALLHPARALPSTGHIGSAATLALYDEL